MKKVICTYGTADYNKSLNLLEKTAYELGKNVKFMLNIKSN
jgi:hypothetical protein